MSTFANAFAAGDDGNMTPKQLRRFIAKISFEERDEDLGECWLWTGALVNQNYRGGYGKLGIDYVTVLAHRVSYEHFIGPIPDGHEIDHLCRMPRCVNPRHLEAVAKSSNQLRGLAPIVTRRPEHAAMSSAAKQAYWDSLATDQKDKVRAAMRAGRAEAARKRAEAA